MSIQTKKRKLSIDDDNIVPAHAHCYSESLTTNNKYTIDKPDPDVITNPLTGHIAAHGWQHQLNIVRIKQDTIPWSQKRISNMDSFNFNWHETWMNMALVISMRSKDSCTKVGGVLVDANDKVVGMGYNGMPRGITETEEMWKKENKYKYVNHAELNTITIGYYGKKNIDGRDNPMIMYTTLFPCLNCAKYIANTSIIKVIYIHKKLHKEKENQDVYALFSNANITIQSFESLKYEGDDFDPDEF